MWDAIVIGGGAAGFFGAITCAEGLGPQGRVLLLERGREVLRKVKVSGGGRCNVTHACFEPRPLSGHYPRGDRALIGPFHRFGPREIIAWFEARGVALKTEADGRMFPITDDSQTIIDCLLGAADAAGVLVRTRAGVAGIVPPDEAREAFEVTLESGEVLCTRKVLLATGGTQTGPGAGLARALGLELEPPVPSLFTFHIHDARLEGLQGLSVEDVVASVPGERLSARGPMLITHWGLSGPAILKLSAWGARALHAVDYRFALELDLLPGVDARERLGALRQDWARRQIATRPPHDAIPRRLWQSIVQYVDLAQEKVWAQLSRAELAALDEQLKRARFEVIKKSTFKDEFVTCGGVRTDALDMRTMQARHLPGLHVAGELMDVDGITGGFNFQNAWTSGFLAGQAMSAT